MALLVALSEGVGADARPASLDRVPLLDPNRTDFPDASIADCSDLLTAPAGQRGFLFVGSDGRFYFEDGTRGRFWGINVASESVFQPRPIIDAAVAAIARAGFNLVRLHHVDDETGLLPSSLAGGKQRIDLKKLDAIDYWIAQLKRRGIYVYLDLLDYRTFRAEEKAPSGERLGRGAKPYALFNERLIELQRDYAQELLFDHENPYTGLTYAQDPAVCMVELCDENGLFHEEHKLGDLQSPYREELLRRWNFSLLSEYESQDQLARVWTGDNGECHLGEGEDPRRGNVGLPGITSGCEASVPRLASRNMFFASLHREYFRSMIGYLRSRGLRCPVSAVTKPRVIPDLWAAAQELDFIATNYYYDHPYYRRGSEWQLPAFLSGENPLRDRSGEAFAAHVAAARVLGKPIVVREWNVCWPNDWRGPGMLEAAAYARLQDVDAMILFTLDTRPGARRLGFFDVRRDPTRWGLAPLCARLFLEGQVKAAQRTVAVARSRAEVFYPGASPLPTKLYELARVARIGNAFVEGECPSLGDVTVMAGRMAGIRYAGGQAVISSETEATDAYGHGKQSAAGLSGYPAPGPEARDMVFRFGGTLYSPGAFRTIGLCTPFSLSEVLGNLDFRPIGVSQRDTHCLGIRDMRRRNYVFGRLSDEMKLRACLDALGQSFGQGTGHADLDRGRLVSGTEELTVNHGRGVLWVNGPLFHGIGGELGEADLLTCGPLAVRANAKVGACVWQSLDGLPAGRSKRWVVKFVSTARNTGQQVRVHLEKKEQTVLALDDPGREPVSTQGQAAEKPTMVLLNGRPILNVYMRDGSFELCRAERRLFVYCDTAGVRLELPELEGEVGAMVYDAGGAGKKRLRLAQPFAWPKGVALLEVSLGDGGL